MAASESLDRAAVVEVGVHVPNATAMVVEQAERFGLSSIHQLRGRIGRGGEKSYCYLVPDRSTGREAFNRLRILKDTHDGFRIAEWDLKLRGPGEIMGKRQSGVPQFIIEDLDINTKLIYRAQKDARKFVDGEIGTEEQRRNCLSYRYYHRITIDRVWRNCLQCFFSNNRTTKKKQFSPHFIPNSKEKFLKVPPNSPKFF